MNQPTDKDHPEWVSQAYRESDKVQPDKALDEAVLAMAKKQAAVNTVSTSLPIKSKPGTGVRFWLIRGSLAASVALLSVMWVIQKPEPLSGRLPEQSISPDSTLAEMAPAVNTRTAQPGSSTVESIAPQKMTQRNRVKTEIGKLEQAMQPMSLVNGDAKHLLEKDTLLETLLKLKHDLPNNQQAYNEAQSKLFNLLMQERSIALSHGQSWELDEKYAVVMSAEKKHMLREKSNK